MIITSLDDLKDIKLGDIIYVSFLHKVTVHDVMFTMKLSANPKIYNPIFPFKRVHHNSEFIKDDFQFHDDGLRRCYNVEFSDVVGDIVSYENYHVHSFIVATSKRELIVAMRKSMLEIIETSKRLTITLERYNEDFLASNMVSKYADDYPEDLV